MSISYGTSAQFLLPDTANNVISYIRERLGEPTIQVNVTDSQILSRVTDALQFFRDYCEDGTKREYLSVQLTQENIDNNSFEVADNVYEVLRVIDTRANNRSLFTSVNYNMRHEMNFQEILPMIYTSPLTTFVLFNMKLEEIDQMFNFQRGMEFNTYDRIVKIRTPMVDYFHVDDNIIYEAYTIIDPQEHGRMLSDRRFLDLATAMVKKQWGEILMKFPNTPMFGGITFNGDKIYEEGKEEVREAKKHIEDSGYPAMWNIG